MILNKNGSCVIKWFSPILDTKKESLISVEFFISLIYIYYKWFKKVYIYKPFTSNNLSSEFYIIGKHFIGYNKINELLDIFKKFEINQSICNYKIPEYFEELIYYIINHIHEYVDNNIELFNLYFNWYLNKDKKYDEKMKKIINNLSNDEKINWWLKMTKFK